MKPIHLLALAVLFCIPFPALAGTHVWGGATSQFWSTPSNWISGGAPFAGESNVVLIFPSAGGQSRTVIDNINGLVVDKITVAGGGMTFTGATGAVLTFSNASGDNFVDVSNPGAYNVIDPSLPVVLSATTRFRLDDLLFIKSKISGAGALTVEEGKLNLVGDTANTYVGTTTVNSAGGLFLGKAAGLNAFAGPLLVNGGYVAIAANNQIPDSATVTIYNEGNLVLSGSQETVGPLILDQSYITSFGSALLTLGGNIEAGRSNDIDVPVRIGGASRGINVIAGGGLQMKGTISDPISAAGGLVKNGEGRLSLAGENDFSGPVTVNGGSCTAWTSKAFGTPSGGVTVAAGAQVEFHNLADETFTIINETLNLAGTVIIERNVFWTGSIVLSGEASSFDGGLSLTATIPKTFVHTGIISGSGSLRKKGVCRLTLMGNGANTYTGKTLLEEGEVQLSKTDGLAAISGTAFTNNGAAVFWNSDEQIADTTPVILNSGVLDLVANTETTASLSGASGEVKFNNGKLICGNGIDTEFHGKMTGASPLSFVKKGTCKITLDGANTVTGTVQVDAGTLILNGSNATKVNVFPGGALTGTGTVGTIYVASGGKLNLGTLKAKGLNANSAGAQLVSDLTAKGNGMLTSSDTVNIANSTLAPTLNFTPAPGQSFNIISTSGGGSINGTFNGLPQGAVLTVGGKPFIVSYSATGVTLTYAGPALMTEPKITNFSMTPISGSLPATVHIHIEGAFNPGIMHDLQYSDDMLVWKPAGLSATTDAQGHLVIDFDQAAAPRRFFRLAIP